MKDFIEQLKELLTIIGVSEDTTKKIIAILLFIAVVSFIIKGIWMLFKKIFLFLIQKKLNKDLYPFYTSYDVDKATRYYIPTKCQNISPALDEEPGKNYILNGKWKVIPKLINLGFLSDKDHCKYYLILADVGMGKTTFLINLYLAYKTKIRFPWQSPKYNIKIYPLGNPNTLEEVSKIEKPEETILLLDAFDEDIKAVLNYEDRFKEILSKIWKFREVVITCRTQFFPTQKEEPLETGYYAGGESGEFKFQKAYISVFDEKEIKQYLKKKYPFYQINNRHQRRKAFDLVKKIPNLVMRPMLLSYIDDLIKTDKEFRYSYQIYEALVENWIKREAGKAGLRDLHGSEENYQTKLFNFSKQLSINFYKNRKERGGYFINKADMSNLEVSFDIQDFEKGDLSDIEKRSRSLLNRDALGNYKFSHKSILEYFLALELIENKKFKEDFSFDGMDMAETFYIELTEKIHLQPFRNKYKTSYGLRYPKYGKGTIYLYFEEWETKFNEEEFLQALPNITVESVKWVKNLIEEEQKQLKLDIENRKLNSFFEMVQRVIDRLRHRYYLTYDKKKTNLIQNEGSLKWIEFIIPILKKNNRIKANGK